MPTEIYNSGFILEAFGNATTAHNRNSSRFNRYLELQFDVDGTIAGAKNVIYSLEAHRIAQLPAGERPFNVFNYLLAGATHEERSKFKLHEKFAYLGDAQHRATDEDKEGMANLRLVMKTLGLTKKIQSSIFQTLAVILHLGNVNFAKDTHRPADQAYAVDREHLEFVADLMEVDVDALEGALTNRSSLVGDTMCTEFLDPAQAKEACGQLAATIYSLLFTYLAEHVNSRLANNAGSNFIGLMDFAGFESAAKNGFQQLINNYAAEKIQRFVQEDLIDTQQKSLIADGLTVAFPAAASGTCLDLFEAKPNGLIAVLDDLAQKQSVNMSPPDVVGAMAKQIGKSPYLGVSEQAKGRFGVRHYATPVMYDAAGLVQRNRTNVSADYLKLFRTSTGAKTKTFLSTLFNDAKLETQKHPKNGRALVGGRRLLSTRRPTVRQRGRKDLVFESAPPSPLSVASGSVKVSTGNLEVNKSSFVSASMGSLNEPLTPGAEELSKSSVFSHFRDSLDELISTFKEVRCWFVLGINPTSNMEPGVFKDDRVKQQIQAFEIAKLAKSLHEDYAINCTFTYFLNRYKNIVLDGVDANKDITGTVAELKKMALDAIAKNGWTQKQVVAGNEKIFIAENLWRTLESQLDMQLPAEMRRINRAPLSPEEREEYAAWEDQVASTGLIADVSTPADAGKPSVGKALSRASLINIDVAGLDEEAVTGTEEAAVTETPSSPAKGVKAEPADRTESFSRRCWKGVTTFNTWWIPEYFIIHCGKMKRPDVRQAWREKVGFLKPVMDIPFAKQI